jgi:hypothetical protein
MPSSSPALLALLTLLFLALLSPPALARPRQKGDVGRTRDSIADGIGSDVHPVLSGTDAWPLRGDDDKRKRRALLQDDDGGGDGGCPAANASPVPSTTAATTTAPTTIKTGVASPQREAAAINQAQFRSGRRTGHAGGGGGGGFGLSAGGVAGDGDGGGE